MKNIVAASFAALLLASAVAANAACLPVGSNAGNGNVTAAPVLPAQGRAPVAAHAAPRHTNGINPWDVNLATQTGYGR